MKLFAQPFLFLLLVLAKLNIALGAGEVWRSSVNKDDFSNETIYSANGRPGNFYKPSPSVEPVFRSNFDYMLGVRCDVSPNGSKDFMLTFGVSQALSTPNSSVNVLLKVDENSPIRFTGKLFSDSYTAGFVRITPSNTQVVRKYISQAISGTKVKVRVHNDRKSEIEDYAVLLAGFTKHTAAALKACEISAAESEMNTQDQARLEEIEAEVSRLEREKQNILSKY
tara:strand:+ start:1362 stop:2036 length:675 start_codon:yes stop_codon:yes gene_type:complete